MPKKEKILVLSVDRDDDMGIKTGMARIIMKTEKTQEQKEYDCCDFVEVFKNFQEMCKDLNLLCIGKDKS